MKQLPHKPGLYMAQDDSIWLFDGDYFSLIREGQVLPGLPCVRYPEGSPAPVSNRDVCSTTFIFCRDEPGYYRSADKSPLLLDCGEYRLVAAALTPVSNTSKKACLQPESAWVSENIVERTRRSNAATMIS